MPTNLPDVANHTDAHTEGFLERVGMSNIAIPLVLESDTQQPTQISARVSAYVNLLNPKAKGIHMSRLYLLLDKLSTEGSLSLSSIQQLLQDFITSHHGLSDSAQVIVEFDVHLRRKSLISGKQGWKAYPTIINAELTQGQFSTELSMHVPYSSTCPCSAALARQLIQDAFNNQYGQQGQVDTTDVHQWLGTVQGIVATPHSQRSIADVKVKLADHITEFPLEALVDSIENSLKTPVQAAVKREDEQEFARLNGQNLMFCEDAARKVKHALNQQADYADFWLRVNHLESLHAHDAVAISVKGLDGGYQA